MHRTPLVVLGALLVLGAPSIATAADCTGTSAAVAITTGASHSCPSSLSASGSWSVSGAAGVSLKYYVGTTLIQEETRFGSSGSWSLSDTWSAADGNYTLHVDAFPLVDNGSGYTTCLQQGTSASDGFSVSCAPDISLQGCNWNCPYGPKNGCTGTCTISIVGGMEPFDIEWGTSVGTQWQYNVYSRSVTSPILTCSGFAGEIFIQATDDIGRTSNTITWGCGI